MTELDKLRQIYVYELSKIGHGLPLWSPEPAKLLGGRIREPAIGGVGYVNAVHGGFTQIFNLCEKQGEGSNEGLFDETFGDDEYTPFRLNAVELKDAYLSQLRYTIDNKATCTVQIGADLDVAAIVSGLSIAEPTVVEGGGEFHFASQKQDGAVLVIKPHGNLAFSLQIGGLMDMAKNHARKWFEIAKRMGHEVPGNELLLVYGTIKTKAWTLSAMTKSHSETGGSFKLHVTSAFEGCASFLDINDSPSLTDRRSGPKADQQSSGDVFDQTVFLRCISIKIRLGFFIEVVKAGAGDPKLEHGRDDDTGHTQTTIELETIPQDDPVKTDLTVLLDYLLDEQPAAKIAVACHNELWALCRKLHLHSTDKNFTSRLCELAPATVVENGVVAFHFSRPGLSTYLGSISGVESYTQQVLIHLDWKVPVGQDTSPLGIH